MDLSRYIDYTLLKPDATRAQIESLCQTALNHNYASVCVNSCHIELVAELLCNTSTVPCCVVGFPLGAMATSAKAFEASLAVELGAKEIDMVMNIGAAKANDFQLLEQDIAAVSNAIANRAVLKVILETCLLTDDEIIKAAECAVRAGAQFVKTSTGFSTQGATEHAVTLMRRTVGQWVGVKASGGIRTRDAAIRMIDAGASRIGASAVL